MVAELVERGPRVSNIGTLIPGPSQTNNLKIDTCRFLA